jgi:hypothetical protein
MKNSYKNLVIIAVVLIAGGAYLYSQQRAQTDSITNPSNPTEPSTNITTAPSWMEVFYKNTKFQIAVPAPYSIYYADIDLVLKPAINANIDDAVTFLISKTNLEAQKVVNARASIGITVQKSNKTIEDLYKESQAYDGPVDGRGTYSPPKTVKVITRLNSPTKALDIQFNEAGYPTRIVEIVGGGYQYNLSYDKTAADADILEEIVSTFSLQ